MSCNRLSLNILRSCEERPVMGIEQSLYLINKDDVAAITKDVDFPNALATGIDIGTLTTDGSGNTTVLNSAYAIKVEGVKQIMNYTNSLESSEDSENGVIHSIAGIRIYDPSEQIRDQVNKFIAGNKVIAILERKWKGTDNKDAFLLFGMNFGLELSELTDNSNENDGTIVMSLSTPSGFKEPYLPHIFRDTDYTTTRTVIQNLLTDNNGSNGGGLGTGNI